VYPTTSSRHVPSIAKHPPYGLFLDPHRGSHSFTAVNPYLLVGILTIFGGLCGLVALLVR
jgi:hypothetical protein